MIWKFGSRKKLTRFSLIHYRNFKLYRFILYDFAISQLQTSQSLISKKVSFTYFIAKLASVIMEEISFRPKIIHDSIRSRIYHLCKLKTTYWSNCIRDFYAFARRICTTKITVHLRSVFFCFFFVLNYIPESTDLHKCRQFDDDAKYHPVFRI